MKSIVVCALKLKLSCLRSFLLWVLLVPAGLSCTQETVHTSESSLRTKNGWIFLSARNESPHPAKNDVEELGERTRFVIPERVWLFGKRDISAESVATFRFWQNINDDGEAQHPTVCEYRPRLDEDGQIIDPNSWRIPLHSCEGIVDFDASSSETQPSALGMRFEFELKQAGEKAKAGIIFRGKDTAQSFQALSYNVADISLDTPFGVIDIDPEFDSSLTFPQIKERLETQPYDLVLLQENFNESRQALLIPDTELYPFQPSTEGAFLELVSLFPSLVAEGDGLTRFGIWENIGYERVNWTTCAGGLADNATSSASDCLTTKGYSYARYFLGDAEEPEESRPCVDVYNTHMDAGTLADDLVARATQVQMLVDDINTRTQTDSADTDTEAVECALIVGGDFNMSDPVADLGPEGTLVNLTQSTGLQDACLTLDCEAPSKVDRFMYRSGGNTEIYATSWEVDERFDTSNEGGPLSDHQAVSVRFEVFDRRH